MNAVIYARVSTDEQRKEGYSIPAQLDLLKFYAQQHNFKVIKEFAESASASSTGRPLFDEMFDILQKGKATTLLVEKVDRLHRNDEDKAKIMSLVYKCGAEIHFVRGQKVFNKDSDPSEYLLYGIESVMSGFYSLNLSKEVKKGHKKKFEKGEWPSMPPIGYMRDPKTKLIVPDPEKAPLVKKLFEEASRGIYSLSDLYNMTVAWGLHTYTGGNPTREKIRFMLSNPFYIGIMRFGEMEGAGIHAPIIEKALFDKVQITRKRVNRPHKNVKSYPFKRLLTCGICGCSITAETKKGKYIYYHCSGWKQAHKLFNWSEKQLEERFFEIICGLSIEPNQADEIAKILRERFTKKKGDSKEIIANWNRKLNELKKKEEKALDSYLSEIISEKELSQVKLNILHERQFIESRIEEVKSNYHSGEISLRTIFELARRLPDIYLKASSEDKVKLLAITASNFSLLPVNLTPTYKKPFDRIAEGRDCQTILEKVATLKTVVGIMAKSSYPIFAPCIEIVNFWS